MFDNERIDANPNICSGKPVIRGTRIMVNNVMSLLGAGFTTDKIIEEYPDLSAQDIQACVHYAMELINEVRIINV